MTDKSRYARALRTLDSPVKRPPIEWTGERIQEELAKALLPLARQQRRELEERRHLEQEARSLRGSDSAFLQARFSEIEARIAQITPPEPKPTRRQSQEYRKRLAAEAAELRRRAERGDHEPAWAKLLAKETIEARRVQLAARGRS